MKTQTHHRSLSIFSATRRLIVIVAAVAFLASAVTVSQPATAQSLSRPRADVLKILGENYAEAPIEMGLTRAGNVIELFTSSDGSTWSLVVTSPDGLSRVVASGENWVSVRPLPGFEV